MAGLRKLMGGLILALAGQQALADDDLLNTVAGCVGRYSAQMEHQWLFPEKPTAHIETQRAHMIDILAALTTNENARDVLSRRIAAKLAHASLLTRAAFSQDAKIMTWAQSQSERQLAMCATFTLASLEAEPVKRTAARETPTVPKTVNQSAVQIKR